MTNSSKVFSAALVGILLGASARAASIGFVGSQLDVESNANDPTVGWRNTTPAKPLDNGDNIFGSQGYRMFGTSRVSLPSYVASITIGGGVASGSFGGYALIDDPNNLAADFQSGTLFVNGAAPNSQTQMFSFILQAPVPGTFRIGLMLDNKDDGPGTPNPFVRVVQNGGGGDSGLITTLTPAWNNLPDWYLIDITGGQPGDQFNVFAVRNGVSGNLTIGGITFDTIPEPSTFMLFGVGGLLVYRRFRGSR